MESKGISEMTTNKRNVKITVFCTDFLEPIIDAQNQLKVFFNSECLSMSKIIQMKPHFVQGFKNEVQGRLSLN